MVAQNGIMGGAVIPTRCYFTREAYDHFISFSAFQKLKVFEVAIKGH
jgi:hypothetical protein